MTLNKKRYATPCLTGLTGKIWPKTTAKIPRIIRDMQDIANNAEKLPIDGVTDKEKKEWLHHFIKGALHAYRIHGSIFKRFEIHRTISSTHGQGIDNLVCYCPKHDTVYLTCGYIASEIKTARNKGAILGNPNTKGQHCFTGLELAFLIGFEETYHCHQYKKLGDQYTKDDWGLRGYSTKERNEYYKTNKVEKDASDAIMNAAGRLGLTDVFPDKGKIAFCAPKPFILSH